MEEKKCAKCGMVLTEENTCSCKEDLCKNCCECAEDCSCGCKKAE